MKTKHFMAVFAVCLGLSMAFSAVDCAKVTAKEAFPRKNITWIVTYSPGGGFDVYSRAIARTMSQYLPKKVHIIIKNLPGAGGTRGASVIYRSKADGYTVGILNFPGLAAVAMVRKMPFDLDKYTYVGRVAITRYCLSVPKDSPFRTLKDLQQAKKTVRFPETGKGATSYLVTAIGTAALKIPMEFITGYPSSVRAIVATIKGDGDAVMIGGIETQLPFIKAGDLRPIVTFASQRSQYLPDTPTVKELGYDSELDQLAIHRLVAAPPGLKKDAVATLRKAFKRSLEDEGLKKWSIKAKRPLNWASGEEAKQIVARFNKMLQKYKDLFAE